MEAGSLKVDWEWNHQESQRKSISAQRRISLLKRVLAERNLDTAQDDSKNLPQAQGGYSRRLNTEFHALIRNTLEGVQFGSAKSRDERVRAIEGPKGTLWEGGRFEVSVKFPAIYPHEAPAILFITKMFHSSICDDGYLCIDHMLPNDWTAAVRISEALANIRK
jgi:ubiquitin-protein ligase